MNPSVATKLLFPKKTCPYDRMLDMLIALIPPVAAGCIYFGVRAVLTVFLCIAAAVGTEAALGKLLSVPFSCKNLSAAVTGLLIALCLPPSVPIYAALFCTVAAVAVTRMLFGGYGCEIVSTAAFGAALAYVCFPRLMRMFNDAFTHFATSEIPLIPGDREFTAGQLLFGAHGGAIGEVGTVFLLAGGLYLCIRRVLSPVIPLVLTGSVALFSFVFGLDVFTAVCGSGTLLCAIFIAPDPVTAPSNLTGSAAYAFICGLLTVLLRKYAAVYEGIYFAVLFVALLRPLFEAIPDISLPKEGSANG